ncbi:MAG: hypothetical protein D6737_09640 [Chloroflexi bacterium]|nr:MAG: hypothetical protein CUN54_08010 [Phototrophicales bacterium]RMF79978.1 MAG: hypothetical protein D6737_09640 [Chloroflexota bacterium]
MAILNNNIESIAAIYGEIEHFVANYNIIRITERRADRRSTILRLPDEIADIATNNHGNPIHDYTYKG